LVFRTAGLFCSTSQQDFQQNTLRTLVKMAFRAGVVVALLGLALLSTCAAEHVRISLKKGPLAPMASLRPAQIQGLLQKANGGADVPIKNFLDAQVRHARRALMRSC